MLTGLSGVGESVANKLIEYFGNEQSAYEALIEGNISAISQVDGITLKRAVNLSKSAIGEEGKFLSTTEAEKIFQSLVESISRHCLTKSGRDRLQLMTPNPKSINKNRDKLSQAIDFIDKHPQLVNQFEKSWHKLHLPRKPNTRYERVIVSKNKMPHLEKYCRILTPSSEETWKDYTVFKTVTWIGEGSPSSTPDGWLCSSEGDSIAKILPELVLDWFKTNMSPLEVITSLLMSELPVLHDFTDELVDSLEDLKVLSTCLLDLQSEADIETISEIKDNIWKEANTLAEKVHSRVEIEMQDVKLNLSGADMLLALSNSNALQKKLGEATSEIITDAILSANNSFADFLLPSGVAPPRTIFTNDWPCKVDRKILDSLDEELSNIISQNSQQKMMRLAKELHPLQNKVTKLISKLFEMDKWIGIGKWSIKNNCTLPVLGDSGVDIQDGRHLLLGFEPEAISYGLGKCAEKGNQQNLALLSGANSGGKTTLLELLGQIVILTHMGLSVPAKEAKVGVVNSMHILAKAGGTQSAGALEQTLYELAEVASCNDSKFILADELEAITEPGAGAKIIAGMLSAASSNKDTTMVLVTHLAPAILAEMPDKDVRIDGIEAKGLDENMELIVDRTPKRNYLARSTPELIVKRLIERSAGDSKSIFKDILKMF